MWTVYEFCFIFMTFWMITLCVPMKENEPEMEFSLKNPNSAKTNFSITHSRIVEDAQANMMPYQWRHICRIKPVYTCMDSSMVDRVFAMIRNESPICLLCDVRPGYDWDFHELRRFLHNQRDSKSYAIKVRCSKGGNVTLQWPLRAKGLNYISVSKCLLVNYTADYFDNSINNFPDTLVYYSITDCVMYIDVIDFMNVTNNVNKMSKAARCGPEKHLVSSINRNVSYQFKTIPESLIEEVSANISGHTARNYQRGVSVSPITCNYTNLLQIDQSEAKHLGPKHDSVLLQNSDYPVLRLLNLSSTMLTDLPEHLDDWRLYLPRLKLLDLTHNFIKEFKSVMDYGIGSEDPSVGIIDLRYNAITTITLNELKILQNHKFVKVDIRNNPFVCDCAMAEFVHYFQQSTSLAKFGVSGQYKYLLSLKCESPQSLKGRIIADLDQRDLGCATSHPTDNKMYLIVVLAVTTGILVIYVLLTMPQQLKLILSLVKKIKNLGFKPQSHHEQVREAHMIALETSLTSK